MTHPAWHNLGNPGVAEAWTGASYGRTCSVKLFGQTGGGMSFYMEPLAQPIWATPACNLPRGCSRAEWSNRRYMECLMRKTWSDVRHSNPSTYLKFQAVKRTLLPTASQGQKAGASTIIHQYLWWPLRRYFGRNLAAPVNTKLAGGLWMFIPSCRCSHWPISISSQSMNSS